MSYDVGIRIIQLYIMVGLVGDSDFKGHASCKQQQTYAYTLYKKYAQSNLGRGPRRCESAPRGGLITTAKVVAGEFITPHQLLPTLWAFSKHIAKVKTRCSPVLKIDRRCKWCSVSFRTTIVTRYFFANFS